MNIKEKILKDYFIADTEGLPLMQSVISELLDQLNYDEEKIFHNIESLIELKGKNVIRLSRKNKKLECEKETYKMIFLNQYLNIFKFDKPRKIHLNYNPKEPTNPI